MVICQLCFKSVQLVHSRKESKTERKRRKNVNSERIFNSPWKGLQYPANAVSKCLDPFYHKRIHKKLNALGDALDFRCGLLYKRHRNKRTLINDLHNPEGEKAETTIRICVEIGIIRKMWSFFSFFFFPLQNLRMKINTMVAWGYRLASEEIWQILFAKRELTFINN